MDDSGQLESTWAAWGGDDLIFPGGASNLASDDDVSGLTYNSLTFEAPGYSIGGNAVTVGAGGIGIAAGVSGTDAIASAVLSAEAPFPVPSGATLTISQLRIIDGGGLDKNGS